jgi:hypothetical protein
LSAKIASQLSNELNTVLPVSAGLQRVLDDLLAEEKAKFRALKIFVQSLAPDDLDDLLRSQRLFDTLEIDNSPLSPGERKKLRGQMPWRVFVTIARTLQNEPEGAAEDRLKDYAGFDRLKATLDTHFFQRGQIIRCHRLITDAKKLVDSLLRKEIHNYRVQVQQKQARATQLFRFVRLAAAANRDAEIDATSVAAELEQLINQCYCIQPLDQVIGNLEKVEVRLDEVSQYLMQCNWDFCTLQLLEKSVQRFQPDELSELRPLFGLYGLDIEDRVPDGKLEPSYLEKRQQHWRSCAFKSARNSPQREVAERAAEKYGEILYEIEFKNDRRPSQSMDA